MMPALDAEWLQADGQGGFASGTVGGFRTRRYHALLLVPLRPPTARVVLVNGFEAWVTTAGTAVALSTQHYAPDVTHPRGIDSLVGFTHQPWPRWTFALPGAATLVHECLVDPVDGSVVLSWRLDDASDRPVTLNVRPLLSGRDHHALMHQNPAFAFAARAVAGNATWRPCAGLPAIAALSNGRYVHDPQWFRNFHHREEAARGLDAREDLAAPGSFEFDLRAGEAVMVLRAGDHIGVDARALATRVRGIEAARREPLDALQHAAEAYLVRRAPGHTVIAGYPWFTDWGRDTFIAMRGLLLTRAKFDIAASILDAWSGHLSEGMLPNRFADDGEAAEYNAVDASLWFVIVVHELLAATAVASAVRERLAQAVHTIVDAYRSGTRHGIRMDHDALLACGVPGVQLTWMDAKVGDHVITPRIGKPVEVQALWINALLCAGHTTLADQARRSFAQRFWNAQASCLYDVVDADHEPGKLDASVRPNQIFTVGGLPVALLDGERAAAVLAAVQAHLLTPMGLRSLAPTDAAYRGHHGGGPAERDGAYHQGTVWPWLVGAFVDAWLNVHGDSPAQRAAVRALCVEPLLAHLHSAGLGHVSEIADGDAPHTPRGCPFQAWSLGELLRAMARTVPSRSEPRLTPSPACGRVGVRADHAQPMNTPTPLPDLPLPIGLRSRTLPAINGLDMHMLEAGVPGRPLLLLLHGFPELAYSWRKVMLPLAEAGYHVVAPDQRGYGRTTGWPGGYDIELRDFGMLNLARDALGLVHALGHTQVAAVIGHDFGSPVAAWCALLRPDVFRALVMMSAPFGGPPPLPGAAPTADLHAALAALQPPRKHYQQYYCGREANADMQHAPQGLAAFLRAYYHCKSADFAANRPFELASADAESFAQLPRYYVMDAHQGMAATAASMAPTPEQAAACRWLRDDELAVYAAEFGRTGFQGGLNWYRCGSDAACIAQLQLFASRTIDVPAAYIAGAADWGMHQKPGELQRMQQQACTKFLGLHVVAGAGHWVQQEQPEAATQRLLQFLSIAPQAEPRR